MKTSLLSLLLLCALLPLQLTAADTSATAGLTTSTNAAPTGAQGQRPERFKQAMSQLNLTDAQKEQIKQIRSSVTNRKERRQEIMNVLTPDQKNKLRELIQEHRNGAQTGLETSPTPGQG